MAIQTIAIAFDFSEPAGRALRWAQELAVLMHARLEIVQVYPDLYDGRGDVALGLPWPSAGQEDRYLRFLEQEVRGAAQILLGEDSASFGVRVVRGDPVKRFLAAAEEMRADLLVVGATGKGRVQRMMLGSVSEYLLRLSHVPVAVIH
jgi:nucleotide-binding universal stress UspA family protein